MADVYMAEIRLLEDESKLQSALEGVDPLRREEVLKMSSEKMRAQSLTAGLLLQQAAHEKLRETKGIYEVACTEDGKPYFPEHPEIHFSLSHSGNMALCAVADHEVGADIQEWKELKADIAGRFFHPDERKYLESLTPTASEKAFFELWCLKESYIKFTGKGLAQPMAELDFHKVLTDGGIHYYEFTENDTVICAQLLEAPHGYSAAIVEGVDREALNNENR